MSLASQIAVESFVAPTPSSALAALFQPCERCKGSGQFLGRNGRTLGDCYACKGAGRISRQPAADAVRVDEEALRAVFDKLRASGLKRISLRMQGFTVKPAPATGRNAGALYVTEGEKYLGKVIAGRFDRTPACSEGTARKVADLIADPLNAIKASGIETGVCAICGLTLTDPGSIALGIGPICASRL